MSKQACIELAERAGVDPDELVEYWEERAAIREVDGGQARDDAERAALDDMREVVAIGAWVLGERKGPKSAVASEQQLRDRARK